MKKARNIPALFSLIKGIIMILLGTFHIVAFFLLTDQIFTFTIPPAIYEEYAVWFNLAGAFFIYIGISDIIAFTGIRQNVRWAWKMAYASAISSMTFSFIGILVFKEGPPFLIFAIGLMQLIPLVFGSRSKESVLTID